MGSLFPARSERTRNGLAIGGDSPTTTAATGGVNVRLGWVDRICGGGCIGSAVGGNVDCSTEASGWCPSCSYWFAGGYGRRHFSGICCTACPSTPCCTSDAQSTCYCACYHLAGQPTLCQGHAKVAPSSNVGLSARTGRYERNSGLGLKPGGYQNWG